MVTHFMIFKIFRYAKKGRSNSSIAKKLNISRKTVRKYRKMDFEEALKYRVEKLKRKQYSNPPIEVIKEILDLEPKTPATGIYDQLVERGFYDGSERTIQRIVKKMRPMIKKERKFEPVLDMKPGFQAQVDLGENRKVFFKGIRKTIYFISFVLSFSRKKYIEYYDVPINLSIFLEFHKRAFKNIGGVVKEIVYDQTRLVVLKEKYGEVEFNKAFYRFARHYGFTPYICNKYDPQSKGKIENVVKYAKLNFLMGRNFKDLSDLRERGISWLKRRGNGKECKSTGVAPDELFEKYEKGNLNKIPGEEFKTGRYFEKRNVNKVGLFSFNGKFYSVPDDYQMQDIKISYTTEEIYITDLAGNYIYTHKIDRSNRKVIKIDEHYKGKNASLRAPSTKELEDKLKIYIDKKLWSKFFDYLKLRFPRHYREQLMGIIELSVNYEEELFKEALMRAVYYHSISWGNISIICNALKDKKGEAVVVPLEVDFSMRLDITCDIVEERGVEYYQQFLLKEEDFRGETRPNSITKS